MSLYQKFIRRPAVRRATVLLLIGIVLWLMRGMISTILLTFIFAFLVTRLVSTVRRHLKVPTPIIVLLIYALVIAGLYYVVVNFVPLLANQSIKLVNQVYHFYESPSFDSNTIMTYINNYMKQFNLAEQVKSSISTLFNYLTSVGSMGVTFVLSLLLSFVFSIEVKSLKKFGALFLESPDFGWFFSDITYFAKKFINTFGVVIETQLFIAVVNTAITVLTLAIMKMPNLPSLGLMVFVFSLVPVAGVIISCIPLTMVAFSVGGIKYVVYILVMIVLIHTLETYVLNPKFMASRTQLPMFFTFIVLLISERLFGVWGLIVGIPIFTFFLDILGVKKIPTPKSITRSSQAN
ncbi:AI-2E family transporter [Lapidilactobacillus dextrinicus]|uniref:AI-2E family transporter n=1 Tax=Lapidilactobacillus dextrinicus TaxID=51664 RepID=UPI0022E4ABD9|nr:AI-2E family transporter [Lapidilactobacillus dextrinicus]